MRRTANTANRNGKYYVQAEKLERAMKHTYDYA